MSDNKIDKDSDRVIYLNPKQNSEGQRSMDRMCRNTISTTNYTIISFVPRNLLI